ncbi:hypothetical protein ACE1TH_17605 [Shouchella sp. JSM 1781072]|uniref:hypothetical protein n=1 Tax=Shouchella sp. JSM 1781072 TaxID=3344581 RepID=UPI0035BFCA87
MRKMILALLILPLLASGCINQSFIEEETFMSVTIVNESTIPMYGFEIEYEDGLAGVSNADESPMKKGEEMTFEFTEDNEWVSSDEHDFSFFLVVDEESYDLQQVFSLEIVENRDHRFRLVGETLEEARLQLTD